MELRGRGRGGRRPAARRDRRELTQAAMDAGVYGINMPTEWGGAGLTLLEQVIVEEEFGKVTNCLWDIPWRPSNVLAYGIARAAGEVPAADPARRALRRLRHHRARVGVGRRRHPDHGDAGRGRLAAQRREVVRHLRRRRRLPAGAGRRAARQRVHAVLRREGHAGRADQPDAPLHALRRQRPPRVRVRGRLRPRPTRCSARSARASS